MNNLPWAHTSVTQFILCIIFITYVATIHLNGSREESKRHNLQYLTPVTLKQSQFHQKNDENIDPTQGYNHAKFEESCFDSVWVKCELRSLFQARKNLNFLPWTCAKIKFWYIHNLLDVINNCTQFQLNWIRTSKSPWIDGQSEWRQWLLCIVVEAPWIVGQSAWRQAMLHSCGGGWTL